VTVEWLVSSAENRNFSNLQWAIIDRHCDALSSRNWNKAQVSYDNVPLNTYFSFRFSSTHRHPPKYLASVVQSSMISFVASAGCLEPFIRDSLHSHSNQPPISPEQSFNSIARMSSGLWGPISPIRIGGETVLPRTLHPQCRPPPVALSQMSRDLFLDQQFFDVSFVLALADAPSVASRRS
jgi:hypothetical protein